MTLTLRDLAIRHLQEAGMSQIQAVEFLRYFVRTRPDSEVAMAQPARRLGREVAAMLDHAAVGWLTNPDNGQTIQPASPSYHARRLDRIPPRDGKMLATGE